MLAPMATLNRAAARAHDALHTAEQLAEVADVISGSSEESDEEVPEELEPEEAREVVEEVYEPLMGRKASRSASRTRHDHEHRGEVQERKVRKLEVYLSYGCFLILGESIPRQIASWELTSRQAHACCFPGTARLSPVDTLEHD